MRLPGVHGRPAPHLSLAALCVGLTAANAVRISLIAGAVGVVLAGAAVGAGQAPRSRPGRRLRGRRADVGQRAARGHRPQPAHARARPLGTRDAGRDRPGAQDAVRAARPGRGPGVRAAGGARARPAEAAARPGAAAGSHRSRRSRRSSRLAVRMAASTSARTFGGGASTSCCAHPPCESWGDAAASPESPIGSARTSRARWLPAWTASGGRSSPGSCSARTRGLSAGLADAFRASGLYHLLAVSGQNVALIVGGVLMAALDRRHLAHGRDVVAIVAIVGYLAAVGWQPSVVRAGVAGVLASLAWLAARPSDRWYFLLAGAAVLLAWSPYAALDPGFQLSFGAVAAILRRGAPSRTRARGIPGPARRRRRLQRVARVRRGHRADSAVALRHGAGLLGREQPAGGARGRHAARLRPRRVRGASRVPCRCVGIGRRGGHARRLPRSRGPDGREPSVRAGRLGRGCGHRGGGLAPRRRRAFPAGASVCTRRRLPGHGVAARVALAAAAGVAAPARRRPPRDRARCRSGRRHPPAGSGRCGARGSGASGGGRREPASPTGDRTPVPARADTSAARSRGGRGRRAAVAASRRRPRPAHPGAESRPRTGTRRRAGSTSPGARRSRRDDVSPRRASPARALAARAGPGAGGSERRCDRPACRRSASVDVLLTADAESNVTLPLDLPQAEILKVAHHGSADDGLDALLRDVRPQAARRLGRL